MAGIIPRANESAILQPRNPVPIRGASSVGAQYGAQADLGNTLTKIGGEIVQHVIKQEDMAQQNKYEIASSHVERVYSESLVEAKQKADPDGSNLQQLFEEISGPKIDEVKKTYGPAAGPYADKLNSFDVRAKNHMTGQAFLQHTSMLENYNSDQAIKIGDVFADSVRENPHPDMVKSRIQNYGTYVDGLTSKGIVDGGSAMKLKNGFMEKVGLSYTQGLMNQQRYGEALTALSSNQKDPSVFLKMDPREAKDSHLIDSNEADSLVKAGKTFDLPLLTNKKGTLSPEMTMAMRAIDPLKKATLEEHLRNKVESEGAMRLGDLNANLRGFEHIAMSGGMIKDEDTARIKNDINQNSALTPFARRRAMDSVNVAVAANHQIQTMMSAPRSQWDQIAAQLPEKIKLAADNAAKYDPKMAGLEQDMSIQANRMEAQQRLAMYANQLKENQSKDAASFAIHSDSGIQMAYLGTKDNDPATSQKYATATLNQQKFLEVPNKDQKILPTAFAKQLGDHLVGIPDAESKADFVNKLQQQWGPHFSRVMQEISKSDKELGKFQTITFAPADKRTNLIDSVQNQGAIQKAFQQRPEHTTEIKDVRTRVGTQMREFSTALMGGRNDSSGQEFVNNFSTAIETQAMRDINRGADSKTAVDNAYKDIVASQYNVVHAANNHVIVPKQIEGLNIEPDHVAQYMRSYTTVGGLKGLGLYIPNDPAGKYQRDPESFYTDVEATGRWVTNQGQDGVRLMTVGMDGTLAPVYDKYGKSVEKKFTDIMRTPVVGFGGSESQSKSKLKVNFDTPGKLIDIQVDDGN